MCQWLGKTYGTPRTTCQDEVYGVYEVIRIVLQMFRDLHGLIRAPPPTHYELIRAPPPTHYEEAWYTRTRTR